MSKPGKSNRAEKPKSGDWSELKLPLGIVIKPLAEGEFSNSISPATDKAAAAFLWGGSSFKSLGLPQKQKPAVAMQTQLLQKAEDDSVASGAAAGSSTANAHDLEQPLGSHDKTSGNSSELYEGAD